MERLAHIAARLLQLDFSVAIGILAAVAVRQQSGASRPEAVFIGILMALATWQVLLHVVARRQNVRGDW